MFLINIINFFKGYLLIRVDGFFTERFVNLCIKDDILLWDIKRAGDTRLFLKLRPSDFKKLRYAAVKTKSKVSIVKKSGLFHIIFKYRKRKLAVCGVVLFFCMLLFFNSHIMGIDITGNERIETAEIKGALKDFGVFHFAPIKKIDRRLVQNEMMTRLSDIAWIGINIKGSRVYVEVKERLDTKVEDKNNIPADLIAKSDGIIDMLDIEEGQSMVKKGEFVEKGDLLVSGAQDSQVQGIRYVRASGEVYAMTNYEKSGEYSFEITEKIPTGKKKKKYSIKKGDKALNLYFKEDPGYKNYEIKEEKKDLGFGLSILSKTYLEQEIKKHKESEKATFERGKKDLAERLKNELPKDCQIKNISYKYEKKDEKTLAVTVYFEVRENIAQLRPIDKIENLNYDILNTENKDI